jgi:protein SHQ1
LRLTFSHSLLEDDASSADYNPSSGYLAITLTKENKGQEFQDLDLLTRLLAPRKTKVGPMIEALLDTDENKLASQVGSLSIDNDELLEGKGLISNILVTRLIVTVSRRK